MTPITVTEGQTIPDIVVQYLGDASRAGEVALLNDLSLSDELEIGQVVEMPDADINRKTMIDSFKNRKIKPASNDFHDFHDDEGIGFWIIEDDFIVS